MTSIKDTPEYRTAQAALESYVDDKLAPLIEEIGNLRNEVEELKRRLLYPNA